MGLLLHVTKAVKEILLIVEINAYMRNKIQYFPTKAVLNNE